MANQSDLTAARGFSLNLQELTRKPSPAPLVMGRVKSVRNLQYDDNAVFADVPDMKVQSSITYDM